MHYLGICYTWRIWSDHSSDHQPTKYTVIVQRLDSSKVGAFGQLGLVLNAASPATMGINVLLVRKGLKRVSHDTHTTTRDWIDIITKGIQNKTTPCPIHTKLPCFKSMPAGQKLLWQKGNKTTHKECELYWMDRGLHSDDVTTTRFLAILHVHVTCHAVTCCFMVYACHRMSRFFTIRISGFANFVPEKYTPKMAKKVTFHVKTPLKVTLGRFRGVVGTCGGSLPGVGQRSTT